MIKIPSPLLFVAILATNGFTATSQAPAYRITNDGDKVNIEVIGSSAPAEKTESPLEQTKKRIEIASIAELLQLYRESFQPEEQTRILSRVSKLSARSFRDIQALLGFYLRDDRNARSAAEQSLQRLSRSRDSAFSSFFIGLLDDQDPKLRMFALVGIERLRPEEALEILYTDAKKPFEMEEPSLRSAPTPTNNWKAQLLTLDVLAAWEGKKVIYLLHKRAKEAPIVAKLASDHFWEEALPQLMKWSRSRKSKDQTRANAGWRASPPLEALKATKKTLWEVLESKKFKRGIRHQAAIKLGIASAQEDVSRLLKLRSEARSEKMRVLYDASLFASRDPRVVPILRDYILKHPDPASRSGALMQISDMVKKEEYKKLLLEMAHNDPDKGNRDRARKTLELSKE